MRLKLTLQRPGQSEGDDILVTIDTMVTVRELATTIRRCDPRRSPVSPTGDVTIRIDGKSHGRVVPATLTVAEAGLHSGDQISIVSDEGRYVSSKQAAARAAVLVVTEGPDAGKQFPLRPGANQIGRDRGNEVRLSDPLVSKQHARINVGEVVEIIDLASSNGVLIGAEPVDRAVLQEEARATLGDTVIRVTQERTGTLASPTVQFNRSAHLDPNYQGEEFPAPEPPRPFTAPRVPFIPLFAPVVFGAVMFAITRQVYLVLFVALSPLLMLGNVIESRRGGRRTYQAAVEEFRASLADLGQQLQRARVEEIATRLLEHPPVERIVAAGIERQPLLWERRPDRAGFLELRVGTGRLPSRNTVKLPTRSECELELRKEMAGLCDEFAEVEGVPVVLSLLECGTAGMAGARAALLGCVRSLLAQLAALHSPAEVTIGAIVPPGSVGDWDWLKWLPHVGSDHSPVAAHHLASTPAAAVRLVAAIEEVLEDRGTDRSGQAPIPSVVLVVENGAPVERSRLVELSELGSRAGVYVLWLAPTKSHLPAACKTFIELNPAHPGIARVSWVNQEHCVAEVAVESLEAVRASGLARTLSPVVDAGARVDDDSDLPRAVSLVSLLGLDALSSPDFILDRWRLSNSLPAVGGCTPGSRRRRENHLRALVGAAAGQGFVLDLRTHGPHALVGGTTGAGKSEFLQAWVMGLAAEHSPARVTFLFVDYKGGAAFGDCVRLPHAVGLVTDLSPHLVARALTSLNAELRYREEILRSAKAKDLLELERRGEGEIPPSLVIVVDEFAALAQEVPEFVDGVVNVAQRGRSLGLHLILATQQPAGVIKGNLRANTNLRVALRMADPDDSVDVVGTPQAAAFDPGIPGRALAKMGPTRLTPFQSGYVGGWTSAQPPKPIVTVEDFGFGQGATWEEQEEALVGAERPQGPNDLHRMVSTIRGAFDSSGMAAPRRPWLDTLANVYDLARSPQSRTDSELIFGVLDAPERIQQDPVAFLPDHDGNMVVYGTGGSGKSTFLRTLGIVAGLSTRGGPCHVYGLDFGTRGLQMLETLPHVGGIINGDDQERVTRLLGMLRRTVDDRAVRYAAVSAGSIGQYRSMAKMPQEPRILVLLDGIGPFRQTYEAGPLSRWFDMFQGIAADGRQVGVHMVVSADRQAAVPAALASVIQRRLVLRLAGDVECSMLGVPPDAFAVDSPPGRGFLDGHEVQVAVLGGTATTPRQADAIAALGSELRRLDRPPPAPVGRLTDRVRLVELPVEVGGLPALGIADDTLAPMGFAPEGSLLVIGPPQSGKTTVVATIALSLRRYRPSSTFAYLGSVQSPLSAASYWFDMACGPDDVAGLAKDLAGRLTSASERASGLVVVIEGIAEFLNTPADGPLQELLKACRASGSFVIANGETSTMSSSWPLLQPLKAPRHGIALQPDQIDGDSVFRTSFPRASRVEFPPGRGWYIRGGKVRRIQCALPEDDEPGTP